MSQKSTSVAVVGAGQAGLQLALGLAGDGVDVTLVTDRDAQAIRSGRVLSTQCMFGTALAIERELGIDHWQDDTPQIPGIRYSVGGPDGELAMQFRGALRRPGQSVDQRLKMSAWLEELAERGGRVAIGTLDVDDVEALARDHDLVVVASAKGAIRELLPEIFPRDPARSPYDRPQRNLGVAYVGGFEALDRHYFSINIIPGVGECFIGPALTLDGPCHTMCFEPRPGGPMDVFADAPLDDGECWLAVCREVLERFMPWEAERCGADLRLTDPGGTLKGAITPVVREAAGRLPSGRPVLGLGDAVVQNDPLVGQGANNATKAAIVVQRAIREHPGGPVGAEWTAAVAGRCWEAVRCSTTWTNLMLNPPAHIGDLLTEAANRPAFADTLANGTDDPTSLFPWIESPEGVRAAAAEAEPGAAALGRAV
ncbi:styrene monooxygenase/indole monooxygenase family protein [Capillimicrobium parvum]|uniref:Styrene monooxygenase StyA n=1 Tax=Capillimicrobium parvum TaxID=2884022 RepID=A0A9E6XTQ3_9ACTN|nr:styrene monooxygenase/indole monooxygenase family protein [Capillimicrobium parvum]UGS33833.1 Styrene monooxygenase StyA [Capillimicrobium parvum]